MERRSGTTPPPAKRTTTQAGAQLAARPTQDTVIGLRVWGTAIEHRFPPTFDRLTIGSDPACDIRIEQSGVSRLHAVIERHGPTLVLTDQGSKNFTFCSGERQHTFHLAAGQEIRFGEAATVVAFSEWTQTVRARLQRFLGYGTDALGAVEAALRALVRRNALGHLGPSQLALTAPRGVLALARLIHEVTCGDLWPLTIPDAIPEDIAGQKELLHRAAHGTLVIDAERLPARRAFLFDELAGGMYRARLVLLAPPLANVEELVGARLRDVITVIDVPPLAKRRGEIDRVVADTLGVHLAQHGASGMLLSPDDRRRLEAHRWPDNYDELDEAVSRLVLIRKHGSLNRAAPFAGMTSSGLSRWAKKYGFRV